jgi:hypothetical protein
MKIKYKAAAAILATFAMASSLQAALITGSVQLSANLSTISIDYANNTVTFDPASPALNARVDNSTGALATLLPVATLITYKDFQYDPLVVANPIWSSGSVWFNLTSITGVTEIPDGPGFAGLVLFGTGTIHTSVAGYEETPGTWSFNASTSGAGEFAWGSTASAVTQRVPDGGSALALLGLSILGLGGARRFLPSLKK